MREKQSVEDVVVAAAETDGWEVRKTQYAGRRSCPDRHFYGFGHCVVMEFKRPNDGHLSGGQVRERERLKRAGFHVYVFDTPQPAIDKLAWFKANPGPHARA